MRCFILAGVLLCLSAVTAFSQTAYNFAWDAPVDASPMSYRLQYGSASGNPTTSQDVGLRLDGSLTLDPGTWYVSVVAVYDTSVSAPSNEVQVTVPQPPVDPCVADPLTVTVMRWPTNNGGKNLVYTASQPIATIVYTTSKNKVTAMRFTDTRGCTVTVTQ